MISINEKKNCCGCSACVQSCPKQCITMDEDREGFLYPRVNQEKCIGCGLCEKVCPFLNFYDEHRPIEALAAINVDSNIRRISSSGGIFYHVAVQIIEKGGVVFGVRFDDKWNAIFDYAEEIKDLIPFIGSKYVQARVGDSYSQCERFLNEGRIVLYTGTPCQISGLNHFLRKSYENLLTCDVACHGVPSPKVWSMYLDEIIRSATKSESKNKTISSSQNSWSFIKNIRFRDKSDGWKKYHFVLSLNSHNGNVECTSNYPHKSYIDQEYLKNIYMRAFLNNLILRPSCYDCRTKCGRSQSDITLADYWGINKVNPEMDDDKGTSLVLINTEKAFNLFNQSQIRMAETSYDLAVNFNNGLKGETKKPHVLRDAFFTELFSDNVIDLMEYCLLPDTSIFFYIKHPIDTIRRIHLKIKFRKIKN